MLGLARSGDNGRRSTSGRSGRWGRARLVRDNARVPRLRLLQLVHGYPPAIGGVELSTKTLCERLVADYDVDVTVYTTNAFTVANFLDGSLPTIPIVPHEEQNGVRIRRFPVETRLAPFLRPAQSVAWRLRLPGNDRLRTWYHGPIAPLMLEAVRTAETDVVCAASFPLNHLTYPFRRPSPQPPVVLVAAIHTENSWGYARPNLLRLVARSYATVTHTSHERDWLVEHGAPAARLRVIGHGIELDDVEAASGAFRARADIPAAAFLVAYVGQQAGHKGIDTLLDVFPRLAANHPDAYLVVAGARTPFSDMLAERMASLPDGIRARVRMLDNITNAERAEILADCDVFASPSQQEAFGITTLEAWAHGKPVVVGDSPSQRTIVEAGRTGLLVPYGDRDRLLSALVTLADDPALRQELGSCGRRTMHERYVLGDVVRAYYELFSEAAAARSSAPSRSARGAGGKNQVSG